MQKTIKATLSTMERKGWIHQNRLSQETSQEEEPDEDQIWTHQGLNKEERELQMLEKYHTWGAEWKDCLLWMANFREILFPLYLSCTWPKGLLQPTSAPWSYFCMGPLKCWVEILHYSAETISKWRTHLPKAPFSDCQRWTFQKDPWNTL